MPLTIQNLKNIITCFFQSMEKKVERIALWANGKPQPPVRIELHPTNRCNLKCKFCWQSTTKSNSPALELSNQKLISIVDEAGKLGVKEWIISGGGEPLVRKNDTLRVLERIKMYNMWGQLTTNGALFDEKSIKTIIDIGWDQIQFSVDGPDAKTHDYLRGVKGTFERVVKNAGLLSEYKSSSSKKKPYLGFNVVLNRLNYNKLPDIIQLCHEVGFNLAYFEPVYPGYIRKERLTLNEDEKEELQYHIKTALKTAKKLRIDTNIGNFYKKSLIDKEKFKDTVMRESEQDKNPYLSLPCYQPWYLMGIKACGLAGCCSTFEIGEKIQTRTLKEVWDGPVFNKIRRDMLSKNLPHYCSKCSVVVVMDNKEIRERLKKGFEKPGMIRCLIRKWMKR